MRTAIDAAGREGRIELEPAGASTSLRDSGGGPVAVPAEELPPLTDEIVRETSERTRR